MLRTEQRCFLEADILQGFSLYSLLNVCFIAADVGLLGIGDIRSASLLQQ